MLALVHRNPARYEICKWTVTGSLTDIAKIVFYWNVARFAKKNIKNDFIYSISVLATVAQAVICYLTPQLSPHIHLSFISFREVFSTETGALYYPCLLVVEHSGEKMRASRCFCVGHQLDRPPSTFLVWYFTKNQQRTCFSFIFYFGL